MVFRDEGTANRARVEALEADVARLTEENAALRAASGGVAGPSTLRAGAALAVSAVLSLSLAVGAWYAGFVVSGSTGEQIGIVLGAGAALALAATVGLIVLSSLLIVVPPHRIAVIAGRNQRNPDGVSRGFTFVSGGRAIRRPFIETFLMLPDGPFAIDTTIGRVILRAEAIADIRVKARLTFHRDERRVTNAAERFLGASRDAVIDAARDTIEGALRNLATMLTAEELSEDREKAGSHLMAAAEGDLDRLGLAVDTLHILDCSVVARASGR